MRSPLDVVAQVLLDHQVHGGTEADQGDEWYHEDIAAEAMREALKPSKTSTPPTVRDDGLTCACKTDWLCFYCQTERRAQLERL